MTRVAVKQTRYKIGCSVQFLHAATDTPQKSENICFNTHRSIDGGRHFHFGLSLVFQKMMCSQKGVRESGNDGVGRSAVNCPLLF